MAKVIFTRANRDGSFDAVGMNNRTVQTYSSERTAHSFARRYASGRKQVRLEWFHEDKLHAEPFKVEVLDM